MTSNKTIPERIADELSGKILEGEYPPGSRLPSVRKLSAEYGVNVSTIQRVLLVVQERGLARARDRAGIEVLEPHVTGGTALWPVLLATGTATDRAAALLEDALAARRLLAVSVLGQLSKLEAAAFVPALEGTIASFAAVVQDPVSNLQAVSEAETRIIRTLLLAAERPAVLAIFNDISRMLATSPGVLKAIYANPQLTLGAWQAFLGEARNGDIGRYAGRAATVLQSMDDNIIAAFRANHASELKEGRIC